MLVYRGPLTDQETNIYETQETFTRSNHRYFLCHGGGSVAQVIQQLGVTEQTFYRWRNQYGGMKANDAKRSKELEKENARLKHAVAELTIDKQILKEGIKYLEKL